jgi:type VI secretion system protein ImpA
MKLVGGLQENFWETLFPEIEDGDMEGRANAIESFDKQISMGIKSAPIIGSGNYSFLDYEDSKRFDIPENIDTLDSNDQERYRELQAQAIVENRVTADQWRKAKADTRRAFYEELYISIEECWTQYAELNRVIEEKFDSNQMPGLSNLKKVLDDIQTQVKKLLEEKRAEEPDAANERANADTDENNGEAAAGTVVGASNGAIRSRADALKRLGEVAEFFRKNEPHSPISYLVQRAVKWGEMPLESWLQDVIKDDSVLSQLRQTLGFNTGTTDAEDSDSSY